MEPKTAISQYNATQKDVRQLLAQIDKRVSKFTRDGDTIDWSHVGSMQHVRAKLDEINEFLGGG